MQIDRKYTAIKNTDISMVISLVQTNEKHSCYLMGIIVRKQTTL